MWRTTRLQTLALLALTALAVSVWKAGMHAPALANQPESTVDGTDSQAMTAERAWQRLKAGNNRFADQMLDNPDLGAARRQELSKGQKPFAVVLTCADSRLTPEFIFNQGLGDLFVVRVAGNIAEPYVLGSIEYAVDHLHVPLVVLLGHENCGAVDAALAREKPSGNLGRLIGDVVVGDDLPPGHDAALAAAIKNNVRQQSRLLTRRSDVLKEQVEKKKLRIVSGIYQLASGKVEWLDNE
jgi:carbonic anhydrase